MMLISGELLMGVLPAVLALLTFALILIWFAVSFAYLVAIIRRLSAYRAHIRQLYSDIDKRDLHWVDAMIALLVLIWIVGAFSLADENIADGRLSIEELFLTLIAIGLLVLNYFALIRLSTTDQAHEDPEPDIKYARSALTSAHAANLASRLEKVMRDDALYLDPNLTLQKMAQHVGALPNQLSQTLNQEIGLSFSNYVARWRIEASKPLIAKGNETVLNVALDVGFNSRSTFYKAFKRETRMTPKSYRTTQNGYGASDSN